MGQKICFQYTGGAKFGNQFRLEPCLASGVAIISSFELRSRKYIITRDRIYSDEKTGY
jgi:hypothetical protein